MIVKVLSLLCTSFYLLGRDKDRFSLHLDLVTAAVQRFGDVLTGLLILITIAFTLIKRKGHHLITDGRSDVRLRVFGVSQNIMFLFYQAVMESVTRYGMTPRLLGKDCYENGS